MRTTLFVRLYGAQMVGGFVLLSTWTCRISVPRVGSVLREPFRFRVELRQHVVVHRINPDDAVFVHSRRVRRAGGVGSGYSFTWFVLVSTLASLSAVYARPKSDHHLDRPQDGEALCVPAAHCSGSPARFGDAADRPLLPRPSPAARD